MDNVNYDAFTAKMAKYPLVQQDPNIIEAMYCALGLAGEAGEAVDKIKKWHRDGKFDPESVALELGDVLYYLTRLAHCCGYTLNEIKDKNVVKLTDRANRGVIHGSGDNR